LSVPDFFVLGLAHALSGGFKGLDPSLRFRCSILDPPHPAAIRSVTHLVLAPVPYAAVSPRSLFPNRKEQANGPAPSGPVFLGTCLLCPPPSSVKPLPPCAHPAYAGPENLQCRTVFIQFFKNCGWPRGWGASSNPLL